MKLPSLCRRWLLAGVLVGTCLIAVAQDSKKGPLEAPDPKPSTKQKPEPKFEPREKFDDDPPAVAASGIELPAPGPQLNHACVGPRGTLSLCGWQGNASFLWPIDSKAPRFYREGMVFSHAESQGLVYRLTGRFFRVAFRVAQKPGDAGRHSIWIRNGDKDWTLYQAATAAPHALEERTKPGFFKKPGF